MKVLVRSKDELALMRQSGLISAKALKKVLEEVRVGISLLELEKHAEDEILRLEGEPSFKSVPGYSWTSCLTINHEVVHGIPRNISLKEGDVLSIDLGAVYKGWHTDCAWSVIVRDKRQDTRDKEKEKFLIVGEEALWKGTGQAVEGNRIGDISEAIQTIIEKNGYSVVRALVGHGVGKSLHEDPEIPGFGKKETGMELKKGMTLAIEVIYTSGKPDVVLESDGWTISSADGSWGGLFEMSVVVGEKQAEVLTDWRAW